MTPPISVLPRVLDRCVQDGECWTWTGAKTKGYGRVVVHMQMWRTHRLAYELLVGPIPLGLVLDHLCRNRACVNPDHLDPVPNAVNVARGAQAGGYSPRPVLSHCKRGHEFDEANTRVNRGGARACRACDAARVRARYAARKAAA